MGSPSDDSIDPARGRRDAVPRIVEVLPPGTGRPRGLTATLGRIYLRLFGWRLEGALPRISKAVVIAAPHTSNWDLPHMLAVSWALGVRPAWLGKREIFRFPFGGLMRWLGGVPVDRSVRANLVEQVAQRFAAADRLFLVVPPSGTRSRAAHWKSGFFHMARTAGVPILCAFLDYHRKVGGLGPCIQSSGVAAIDMPAIRAFYDTVTAKYPELATPMRLLEEDTDQAVNG
ncbi:MAG: lysophospholipid acyltransferase family protein [Deltaproteobacteria bacterium]|nr:lysophospholipid acyltransferase family protein [Deltaproteobacteria bacterium]